MKVVCVSGGSYKSFYINHFLHLKKCDVLIFNFGIIYDYDKNESSVIKNEFKSIYEKLGCVIVAGVKLNGENEKFFLVFDGVDLVIHQAKNPIKITRKNADIEVGLYNSLFKSDRRIILSKYRVYPNLNHISKNDCYVFCDSSGASIVISKK